MRRLRRGFTLIELLVVVGMMAAMVSMAVVSVVAGQDAVKLRGATRDILATVREARSVALVSGQPAVITYETKLVDGVSQASVTIKTAKLMDTRAAGTVQTLSGETVNLGGAAVGTAVDSEKGDSVEEVLFEPISDKVLAGMRVEVEVGAAALAEEKRAKPLISVFSTADYYLRKYGLSEKKIAADAQEPEESSGASEAVPPTSIIWSTNGRAEPHRIFVYRDGGKREDGFTIAVDRFGAARVEDREGAD